MVSLWVYGTRHLADLQTPFLPNLTRMELARGFGLVKRKGCG
jgi:hypothetical protein